MRVATAETDTLQHNKLTLSLCDEKEKYCIFYVFEVDDATKFDKVLRKSCKKSMIHKKVCFNNRHHGNMLNELSSQ